MNDSVQATAASEQQLGAAQGQRNILNASGTLNYRVAETELWLANGRVVKIPTALLAEHGVGVQETSPGQARSAVEEVVIPVLEERLDIGKRVVETGKVLLEKHVHSYDETLDIPLAVRTFDIERVVLNRVIDAAPGVRQEGETTIYPIVEEQLVLTKQLILKEELRVTKSDTERRDQRTVTLHRESVSVIRTPAEE